MLGETLGEVSYFRGNHKLKFRGYDYLLVGVCFVVLGYSSSNILTRFLWVLGYSCSNILTRFLVF